MRWLWSRVAAWAVPPKVLLTVGFVPGCACEVCVPGCPMPAMRYVNGEAA